MRKCLLLLVVAVIGAGGFAPAPFPRPRRSAEDPKQIQGEWVLERHEIEGRDQTTVRWQMVIEGNRLTYRNGGQIISDWTISLGPSRNPKTMDSRPNGNLGPNGAASHLGIYKVEGDTLTVCCQPAPARPAVFESKGKGCNLMIFRRAKR
jgi:uncharacterized protein (TIGR03067 family)